MHDQFFKRQCIDKIQGVINKFGLNLRFMGYTETSSLSKFDLWSYANTRIAEVKRLEDEFKNVLGKKTTVDYGDGLVYIILPKPFPEILPLSDILYSDFFKDSPGTLKVALGEDIDGIKMVGDLEIWTHLLIGGEPGGGKSIFLHTLINSLIYCLSDEELKFVMIDTKEVELGMYENISYLLRPLAIDPDSAITTLKWLVKEMTKRKKTIKSLGCRDIKSYNNKSQTKLPYIVVIIDEYANLVLRHKEVENDVIDLAQMARFCGVHLVISTQKPSSSIISTDLKGNIPTRIAFAVPAYRDSMVILDETGAENLNGKGDMYLKDKDGLERIQGCFISEKEIEQMVNELDKIEHEHEYEYQVIDEDGRVMQLGYIEESESFDYFVKASKFCINEGKASKTQIQSHLQKGWPVVFEVMDNMKKYKIISEEKKGRDYQILMSLDEFNNNLNNFKNEFKGVS